MLHHLRFSLLVVPGSLACSTLPVAKSYFQGVFRAYADVCDVHPFLASSVAESCLQTLLIFLFRIEDASGLHAANFGNAQVPRRCGTARLPSQRRHGSCARHRCQRRRFPVGQGGKPNHIRGTRVLAVLQRSILIPYSHWFVWCLAEVSLPTSSHTTVFSSLFVEWRVPYLQLCGKSPFAYLRQSRCFLRERRFILDACCKATLRPSLLIVL